MTYQPTNDARNDAWTRRWRLLLVFTLFVLSSCSSQKQAEPEVNASQEGDEELNNQGEGENTDVEATAAASNGQQAQMATKNTGNAGNTNKNQINNGSDDAQWNGDDQQITNATNQTFNPTSQQATTSNQAPLTAPDATLEQSAGLLSQTTNAAVEPPLDTAPAPVVEPLVGSTPPPASGANGGGSAVSMQSKADVEAVTAELHWVGYDFVERDSIVRIEMVTHGKPKFDVFQERNQANQPELVVRFLNTVLRGKLKRDIDASEFRSPVAYVRMRSDEDNASVDVVMTLRDGVQPRMFSQNGNVMLTFPVPDHYFGNSTVGDAPVARAEVLANANVMPELDAASDVPESVRIARATVNDPAEGVFDGAPADGGAPVMAPAMPASEAAPAEQLPADFSAPPAVTNQAVGGSSALNQADTPPPTAELAPEETLNFDASNQSSPAANQFENAAFDGEPAPAEQANQFEENFDESAEDSAEEQSSQQSQQSDSESLDEELDDDSLENIEENDGDSNEAIDKFDVRWQRLRGMQRLVTARLRERQFTILGVAQDDQFAEDTETQQNAANGQQANAGSQTINNFNQANSLNQANAANQGNLTRQGNQAQAAAGDAGVGEGDFSTANGGETALLGEGGPGNVPVANPVPASNFAPTTDAAAVPAGNSGMSGFGNSAPVSTVNDASMAPSFMVSEPPLTGAPDLAAPESEGLDTEVPPMASSGGRPIKLDFRNAPLKDVIRVLSDESGVNFVVPGDVGDRQININLSGVPFNDALRALLETNQLGMVELSPNLVRIDTLQRLADDKQAQEARQQADRRLKPTKILVHRLSYTKAEDAAKMLAQMLGGAATTDKRISVQTDVRTNSVIVNAPPNDLATVKALLERIDLETPQVKIASRIVEVLKTVSDSLGISWGGPLNFDQGRGLGFGSLPFPNHTLSRYSVDAGGLANRAGNMQFQIGSINNSMALDLALSMEETRGTTDILQSSNLLVEDNREANITAGKSDFFIVNNVTTTGTQATPYEVKYNLAMKVTPHITADGAVQMNLFISSESPSNAASAEAAAARNNRTLETSLLRRSGETAVIGGIYTTSRIKTNTGLPGLSSLPIIGALFRSKKEDEEKRELIVMVTPTIVASQKGGDSGVSDMALNSTPVPTGGSDFDGNNSSGNFNLGTSQNNVGNSNAVNAQSNGQRAANQQSANQQSANQQSANQQSGNEGDSNAAE